MNKSHILVFNLNDGRLEVSGSMPIDHPDYVETVTKVMENAKEGIKLSSFEDVEIIISDEDVASIQKMSA